MRLILPVTASGVEIAAVRPGGTGSAAGEAAGGSAYARSVAALADLYVYPPDRESGPWVRANMISSTDGAAALDGRSGGLSGSADKAVFAVLRSLADVILVGAGTARAERYRPVQLSEVWPSLRPDRAATPAIAVVSRALDLDPDGPLLAGAPGPASTIVLTTLSAPPARRAAAARNARVIVVGEESVEPGAAIDALAGLGHRRILTEGGPGLLGQIAAAGLLDELCVTVSPVLAGGSAGRIIRPAGDRVLPTQLALEHVLEDSGYLLCRYLRQRSG